MSHLTNFPYNLINKLKIHDNRNDSPTKINKESNNMKYNIRIESPSALHRRRALQKLAQLESQSSDETTLEKTNHIPEFTGPEMPFNCLLKHVVAYCEVNCKGEDCSDAVRAMVLAMGGRVENTLNRNVSHVIFKSGMLTTFQRARLLKVHLVSVLWLDALRKHKRRVRESKYPVFGPEAFDGESTMICQSLQDKFDDIIEDEHNELNKTNEQIKENIKINSRYVTKRSKSVTQFQNLNSEDDDIIPSTPDLTISRTKVTETTRPQITLTEANEKSTESDKSNGNSIGNHVNDSFHLKSCSKIRLTSFQNTNDKSKDDNEESLHLHVTTDESGNKSKSLNNNSSNNRIEPDKNLNAENSSSEFFFQPKRTSVNSSKVNDSLNNSRKRKLVASENESSDAGNPAVISNSSSSQSQKTKFRKLYKPNQEFDMALFNWNQIPDKENESPPKVAQTMRKYNVPKLWSLKAKALTEQKRTTRNKQNSKDNNLNSVPRRKSLRILETSERKKNLETDTSSSTVSVRMPRSRKSARVLKFADDTKEDKIEDRSLLIVSSTDSDLIPNQKSTEIQETNKNLEQNLDSSPRIRKVRKSIRALKFEDNTEKNKLESSTKMQDQSTQVSIDLIEDELTPPRSNKMNSTVSSSISRRKSLRIQELSSRKQNSEIKIEVMQSKRSVFNREKNRQELLNKVESTSRRNFSQLSSIESDSDSDLDSETETNSGEASPEKKRKSVCENEKLIEVELNKSKQRRSTLEFVERHSRKSLQQMMLTGTQKSSSKKNRFIVSTHFSRVDSVNLRNAVNQLGGFVIEKNVTKRTTHLVAAKSSETMKMYKALARGCWILKMEWLDKSLDSGRWLEEEDYELTEFTPNVEKCHSERKAFGSFYRMDLFNTCGKIYISDSLNTYRVDLEELVTLCGGHVVKNKSHATIVVGEYVQSEKFVCVAARWILDSILKYRKKSVKKYCIDSNHTNL